ncbi:hypothetical protein [Phenylobacterium sp.]|uniref:hypothetical protein n=1 Tax=Phenylobacterium sp. TaxID=1871053 RepID=UPI002FE168BB
MAWPAHRLAAAAVLVLGIYLQVVAWVDLYPWNDVRRSDGQETLDVLAAAATGVLTGALWVSRVWAPLLSAMALSMWAWLQAMTWWAPYFAGAPPGWQAVYGLWFENTVHVLPRDARHLPPDANHLTLHLLIVAALAASLLAAWRGLSPGQDAR